MLGESLDVGLSMVGGVSDRHLQHLCSAPEQQEVLGRFYSVTVYTSSLPLFTFLSTGSGAIGGLFVGVHFDTF